MAVDKLVDSTQLNANLTSIANAIRTKGGTSAQMEFPNGFVQAINNISGGGAVYTNSKLFINNEQITDVSGFTLLYDDTMLYGNKGVKVAARLAITDESDHSALQSNGWSANGMAFYDAESKIGAYGGYNFGEEIYISKIKLWLGRYSSQNATLTVTVEYLDSNGIWNDLTDLYITPNISYPSNIFTVIVAAPIYGIRWIHKNGSPKVPNTNITFAGMTIYKGIGSPIDVYIPSESELILPPTGYNGFGPLFIR